MRLTALILAIVSVCSVALAEESSPSARITVIGEGRASAPPDLASISFGVISRAPSAKEAMSETSDKIETVLQDLVRFGITGRDAQTSSLSVSPVFSSKSGSLGGKGFPGFEARNQLTVRVRDLSTLGAVLDAILSSGVNDLHGLQFGLQNPGPVLSEARRKAVEDARARAMAFASAAGLTLGRVLTMTESGAAAPIMEMASMRVASSGVPISQGEAEMSAQITVVYELE